MRDHTVHRTSRKDGRKSVGVRELKTHAAGIVRQVREARASYLLTHRGRAIGVILPLDPDDEALSRVQALDGPAAWQAFVQAGQRLKSRFAPERKGVRLLSEMRR